MRSYAIGLALLLAVAAFAQSDRGTITGTISDPAGAVVANAAIEAKNSQTGAVSQAASTSTGNYTLAELPAGTYELFVTVPGFKKYVRSGLTVQAAQIIRVDVAMEVGAATESVTVQADAALLKTESGELSHVVAIQTMDTLPLLPLATDGAGIRNPYNIVSMVPGTFYAPGAQGVGVGPVVRINGGVTASETVLIEGMDATNSLGQGANSQNQPGTDSIQEWAIQTSNYSAEFGQAGSAVMNVTMKSGTNQYHGSVYDYFQNEFLNAGQPFTNAGNGQLLRPQTRRNDYGLTMGGPIIVPKIYNGRDKTFFFFSWEQYLQNQNVLPGALAVPTPAERQGDFSAAEVTSKSLGSDLLGRPIFTNEIYDPTTRQIVNGQVVTNPFPNNTIPMNRFDPVALKIQNLVPLPTCASGPPCNANGLINNYQQTFNSNRNTLTPSLKIDQLMGPKNKLSFFFNRTSTTCLFCTGAGGADGLPQPISYAIGTFIHAHNERLNYDRTISPTVLLHLGAGYSSNDLGQPAATPDYDACGQLGLCGPFTRPATFPVLQNLYTTTAGGLGTPTATLGTQGVGQGSHSDSIFEQFDAIASLTWVKSNHTFKFGGELRNQGDLSLYRTALNGTYYFSGAETALPYLVATTVSSTGTVGSLASLAGNNIGFPYASFLLGLVDTANVHPPSDARLGKQQWGFYVQDNWKVTRKLTLDIGLRYDYSTYFQEQYGRSPDFAPNVANPTAGGHPGSVIYQSTCKCAFAHNYPWGFGPRFGMAYQITPKTVFRGGFGIAYTGTPQYNLGGGAISATDPIGPAGTAGLPIMTLAGGVPLTQAQIAWPNFNPGFYPVNGFFPGAGPAQLYDPNAGRPARQYQWSFGIQREIFRNLLVEASYIGNRGIWWTNNSLVNYNYLSAAILNQYGLSLSNPADIAILSAPLNSPAAGRFMNKIPFTGFPLTATVAQSLRPFPQFSSGLAGLASPLGDTWYDSLQTKVTKRLSHGLDFTFAFTWSKSIDDFIGTPDIQNRALAKSLSYQDQPFVGRIGFSYVLPKWGSNKALSFLVRDWTFTGFFNYASGLPIPPPAANAFPTINQLTFEGGAVATGSAGTTIGNTEVRVPGVSLFTKDLNCHCFDPNKTFVLNPAAWVNPALGQFSAATYYSDYRYQRRPGENMSIGRQFRIRESMIFSVRAEFQNLLNRTEVNNPTVTNPQAPQTVNSTTGATTGGFGYINNTSLAVPPRTGTLVARFQF